MARGVIPLEGETLRGGTLTQFESSSPMSWKALDWATDLDINSTTAKFILLLLADKADENFSCFPSVSTLIAESSAGRSTVLRALKKLEVTETLAALPIAVGHAVSVRFDVSDQPTAMASTWLTGATHSLALGYRLMPKLGVPLVFQVGVEDS